MALSDRLRAYLDRLAPSIAAEILRAFKRMERRLSRRAWVEAVETLDGSKLRALVDAMARDLDKAAALLERIAAHASAEAMRELAIPRSRFDVVNQRAVFAARNQSAVLVREISDTTRVNLQRTVARAFREGIAPRDLAKIIRPMVGLTERQAVSVLNRRARNEAAGWTAARVEKDAVTYAERVRRRRSVLIARTETIRASVNGQVDTWKAAQDAGLLPREALKQWIVTPDDRLCPQCEPMDGETAPIAGFFDTPLGPRTGPPMHPACRCATAIAARSLRRAA